MADTAKDPINAAMFGVDFGGGREGWFQSVSGGGGEVETIMTKEVGEKGAVIQRAIEQGLNALGNTTARIAGPSDEPTESWQRVRTALGGDEQLHLERSKPWRCVCRGRPPHLPEPCLVGSCFVSFLSQRIS